LVFLIGYRTEITGSGAQAGYKENEFFTPNAHLTAFWQCTCIVRVIFILSEDISLIREIIFTKTSLERGAFRKY